MNSFRLPKTALPADGLDFYHLRQGTAAAGPGSFPEACPITQH